MEIYIPSFEKECEIELYFLVSTYFEEKNINGFFNVSDISDGVIIIESLNQIPIDSYEKEFSIKLKFNLCKCFDNEIATFKFEINNLSKTIQLFQKNQSIKNINLQSIKKVINKELKEINNINDIERNSLLISPFACWAKGEFLYRECYINDKKSLQLEIPTNANLYYLSNEGYIQREKNDNYLIIMEVQGKWYSLIGYDDYITHSNFEEIIKNNIDNFTNTFKMFFPKYDIIQTNMNFEFYSKLFIDKSNELIKDEQFVFNLMKNNQSIHNLVDKHYYKRKENNSKFKRSPEIQNLIDKINKYKKNENNNSSDDDDGMSNENDSSFENW